jgi:TPR repeat protein
VRTKCSSFQRTGLTEQIARMLRKAAILIAALAIMISASFSQPPQASAAPQRPLRERLLDRAQHGDAEAQFDLAKGYEGGRFGLTQDFVQAGHWYREAANQGDPFAEASLGIFYGAGKGVKQDYILAYAWLDRSVSHLTGPERDTVLEIRDSIGRRMSAVQLERAGRALSTGKAGAK